MTSFSVIADTSALHRQMDALTQQQVPFALALGLTRLAEGVRDVEQLEIRDTFDTPTPFTVNSITIRSATKRTLRAIVYPKDIAAHYLEPYVVGGNRSLGGKRGMLVPKGIRTNQYGNLTKGALRNLKGKPGVFVGPVKLKNGGTINGVWQRPSAAAPQPRRGQAKAASAPKLKLLIRFADTTAVPRRLPFYEVAQRYVRENAEREMTDALAQAMRTARR